MLIHVDVDNTLYDGHTLFSQVAKENFGVILPEDPTNWHDYPDFINTTELYQIFRKAHTKEFVEKQKPYEGAAETLQWAAGKGHKVVYVSDRHPDSTQALIVWLSEHKFLDNAYQEDRVIVGHDKREWMYTHKPEIVIDDRVRTMVYALSWDATVFSVAQTWNINLKNEVEGVYICKDWNEIATQLDKLI